MGALAAGGKGQRLQETCGATDNTRGVIEII